MKVWAMLAVLAVAGTTQAAIKTETVEYEAGGKKLKGVLVFDDTVTEKRPGVMIVHEWWGLDGYAKMRAEMLAKLGYVAFACDMYGDGKSTEHPADAGKMAGEVRANIETWRGRAKAGMDVLKKHRAVDSTKLAVMGYCFGGSTALQVALSDADVAAVVSFHGALPTPTVEEAGKIKAKVLICNGADDTFISADTIAKFRKSMDDAKVKYTFENYPGAVHSFTVKDSEKKNIKGIAYNKDADEKSWASTVALFKETLGR